MSTYVMNEAQFEIPDEWRDQSINIFSVGTKLPLPLSVVVTRDLWPTDKDFATNADVKLSELQHQLKQFRLIEKKQVMIGEVGALEAEYTWKSDNGPMHQRQFYIPAERYVLVITATAPVKIAEEQQEELGRLLRTFRFNV